MKYESEQNMENKELIDIIHRYTEKDLAPTDNLFGILYPVDIYCIINDIERYYSISINIDSIIDRRKLNVEMLVELVREKTK